MRVIKYNYAPDQFIINRSVECGIAVINVDEKGIRWDKSITSSKEFGTNDNSLSGAYFTKSPKGYNLIFDGFEPIDARKKKSEPVYYFYSFAENGNYTRTIVPAKDDWVINLFRKCHYPCVDEKGNIFRPSHILLPSKIKIVKFQFD
ncbi:MAG: hypothetical protein M0D57_05485 [Sphingobacteriales bacterium JAD_PAG50586_3]|nr:MAG: hypothetical protein M0D57_05485 [Sphingobacteriales bacterium JAD_PAG50586_3]